MNTLSDNDLMLKVKAGDNNRLGLLFERYNNRLFGFFFQMNKDADLSEDLVQNVFIKVLKYKHTFTEESKFVVWLFQIARNASNDSFKKSRKHLHKDIEDVDILLKSSDDIDGRIIKNENAITLKKAIELLSPEKKELILLSKFKELKYKEIGKIIGCTEGAARTKLHRAMNDLKTVFLTLEKR